MQWLVLIMAAAALLVGAALDGLIAPSQPQLFWAFTAASLAGVALGSRITPAWRLWHAPLAALLWRVTTFPVLVFSGFLASFGEWAAWSVHAPVYVYPLFLLSIVALHAAATSLLSAALSRRALALALSPLLLSAVLVSFTQLDDLTILPDHPWSEPAELLDPASPDANPYLPLVSFERSLPQNTLLLCAGTTYAMIPPSPWASAVQGTLEGLTTANPDASTADRVREHYRAYLAAHRRISR
ncbi:MAG: hypothetical protein ACI8S6_005237 [Myxococcota bacterium]|jgi:hypothetical protein